MLTVAACRNVCKELDDHDVFMGCHWHHISGPASILLVSAAFAAFIDKEWNCPENVVLGLLLVAMANTEITIRRKVSHAVLAACVVCEGALYLTVEYMLLCNTCCAVMRVGSIVVCLLGLPHNVLVCDVLMRENLSPYGVSI